MSTLSIKRGGTLQLQISARGADAHPLDLSAVQITSQVRDQADAVVATLNLVPTDTPGQVLVLQDTSNWPLGRLQCDFKLVQAGVVLLSETVALVVEPAVTS